MKPQFRAGCAPTQVCAVGGRSACGFEPRLPSGV